VCASRTPCLRMQQQPQPGDEKQSYSGALVPEEGTQEQPLVADEDSEQVQRENLEGSENERSPTAPGELLQRLNP